MPKIVFIDVSILAYVIKKITNDTTEFKYFEADTNDVIRQKKLYLDPFMDLYNSEILSYRIPEKSNALTVMEGLEEAF